MYASTEEGGKKKREGFSLTLKWLQLVWRRRSSCRMTATSDLHVEANWTGWGLLVGPGWPTAPHSQPNAPPEGGEGSGAFLRPDDIPKRGEGGEPQRKKRFFQWTEESVWFGWLVFRMNVHLYSSIIRSGCVNARRRGRGQRSLTEQLQVRYRVSVWTLTWNVAAKRSSGSWLKSLWSKNSSNSKTLLW